MFVLFVSFVVRSSLESALRGCRNACSAAGSWATFHGLREDQTMQVVLTKEREDFVKAKVAEGRYLDESEVVREAIRRLEDR